MVVEGTPADLAASRSTLTGKHLADSVRGVFSSVSTSFYDDEPSCVVHDEVRGAVAVDCG
jgi:hypothetical protein